VKWESKVICRNRDRETTRAKKVGKTAAPFGRMAFPGGQDALVKLSSCSRKKRGSRMTRGCGERRLLSSLLEFARDCSSVRKLGCPAERKAGPSAAWPVAHKGRERIRTGHFGRDGKLLWKGAVDRRWHKSQRYIGRHDAGATVAQRRKSPPFSGGHPRRAAATSRIWPRLFWCICRLGPERRGRAQRGPGVARR
jgi:hypothetical protein